MGMVGARVDALELRTLAMEDELTELEARLARLEAAEAPAAGVQRAARARTPEAEHRRYEWPVAASPAPRAPTTPRPAPAPASPRPAGDAPAPVTFEDLVGGQLLAWVGGVALLLGVTFFLAIAISRGWLGEVPRCLLAAGGALALLGLAVRLRERGGREEAVLAAAGTALGVLFVDVAVAARAYELLPAVPAALLAMGVGGLGVVLAIRWDAKPVGALGILGGLLAPVLAGAPSDGQSLVLLLVAAAAAGAVLVQQRWDWLGLAAFAVTAPQVLVWLGGTPSPGAVVLGLTAVGVLTTAQAVGFELRTRADGVRLSAAWLLAADALLLSAAGTAVLHVGHHTDLADAWLVALAVAHGGVGLAGGRHPRVSAELRLLALAIAAVLADVAWGVIVDGAAVSIGFAASAVAFAAGARALRGRGRGLDGVAAQTGLGAHLLLAAGHALVVDAPPAPGADAGVAALVLGALATACFASARVGGLPVLVRQALDAATLLVLGYLAAVTLTPLALVLAWAAESVALARLWRRSRDDVAGWGAAVHLGAAAIVALPTVALPSEALVSGFASPHDAFAALAAIVASAGACAWTARHVPLAGRAATIAAAVAALYLASGVVVTAAGGGQTAQMWLSALWAGAGAATLVAGLAARHGDARRAGLGLLALTAVKVFVLDLAGLDSAYRAGSFVALGVLLLSAAFAWQRLRPALVSVE